MKPMPKMHGDSLCRERKRSVRNELEQVSGIDWNECPDCIGITVRNKSE